MKRFGFLNILLKEFKQTKENPELTQYLQNNQAFRKGVEKVDSITDKFWLALDKAAFP